MREGMDRRTVDAAKEPEMTAMPEIVSAEQWQEQRDALLRSEREATRAIDRIAAQRRRLPMVKFDNDKYTFANNIV